MDDNHDDVSQWPMIYRTSIQYPVSNIKMNHSIECPIFCSIEFQEFPKSDAVDSVMLCEISFRSPLEVNIGPMRS